MTSRLLAVLVAAGDGQRLGRPEGKALAPLAGRPLFLHSLLTLARMDGMQAVAIVIRPGDEAAVRRILDLTHGRRSQSGVASPVCLTMPGGATRQASVLCGLRALADAGHAAGRAVVLVHDAARPLVRSTLAGTVTAAAHGFPGCVIGPAVSVVDTLRALPQAGSGGSSAPARENLRLVQTPQAADFGALLHAHEQAAAAGRSFPDELTLGEAYGLETLLVAGARDNIKVTDPADLALAAGLLRASAWPRTGTGFDVHPLVPGEAIRIGGVTIPHDHRLAGHSDADVAVHALMDAILGAAGCGDIGGWFPPGEPRWHGANSLDMLAMMWGRLTSAGLLIGNADVTVAAEAPRLSPHYGAMRHAMAGALAVDAGCINIKATTAEALGFVGRREGIAAVATATVLAPADWQSPSEGGFE